ncbi:MAG: hypothetical protein OXH69_07165 [Acidobacteria bacterium]|nr:hypothetical protein [Acidobacteriota bacterium]
MAAAKSRVDREEDSAVAASDGGTGSGAHGASLRRGAAGVATRKEAFVHRSILVGTTMEVDFGESWVDIAGVPCKVKYLMATLPFSNAYFAMAGPATHPTLGGPNSQS